MIKLKSVFTKTEKSDGYRILITRHSMDFYDFNLHIPELSPSTELTNLFEGGKKTFSEYKTRYEIEMESRWVQIAKIRLRSNQGSTITLLSYEFDSQQSHRSILEDLIQDCNFWAKKD